MELFGGVCVCFLVISAYRRAEQTHLCKFQCLPTEKEKGKERKGNLVSSAAVVLVFQALSITSCSHAVLLSNLGEHSSLQSSFSAAVSQLLQHKRRGNNFYFVSFFPLRVEGFVVFPVTFIRPCGVFGKHLCTACLGMLSAVLPAFSKMR